MKRRRVLKAAGLTALHPPVKYWNREKHLQKQILHTFDHNPFNCDLLTPDDLQQYINQDTQLDVDTNEVQEHVQELVENRELEPALQQFNLFRKTS